MQAQTEIETEPGRQLTLQRVVTWSTALAFGSMIASLEALRPTATGFSFEVSFRTFIAFLLGGTVVFPFWSLLFKGANLSPRKLKLIWGGLLAFLCVLGVGAFLYPLRYVPSERLPEIRTGLLTALCALSGVVVLLWGAKRFLDQDERNGN